MNTLRQIICALVLSFSLSLSAAPPPSNAAPVVGVDEVNTMLALGIIDVVLTTAVTTLFYVKQQGQLCSFGKSQVIPIVNGLGLVFSAGVARATGSPLWIGAAGVFSATQGVINTFRAYLGIWYHFTGGQPLPLMPENHRVLDLIEGDRVFNLRNFLTPGYHLQVAQSIMFEYVLQFDQLGGRIFMGTFIIGIPSIVCALGVVELGIGLHSAIRGF
jgi:hypothetical protein